MTLRKAVVISNCQAVPLAAALSALSSDTTFDSWGAHIVTVAKRGTVIPDFVERARKTYDLILSIDLGVGFLDLSGANIRGTFGGIPLVTISNIYFAGLHPDLTYIGGLSERVSGPMAEYHSKLALWAFLRGLDRREAAALFSAENYESLRFFEEYENSMDSLKVRDEKIDVPVTSILPDLLKTACCMYTVNHPTGAVFAPYADMIVRYLEDLGLCRHSGFPAGPFLCEGALVQNPIYPIYPEIASRHSIPHLGSYAFKPGGPRKNPISLDQFLAGEYEAFERAGASALAETPIGKSVIEEFASL